MVKADTMVATWIFFACRSILITVKEGGRIQILFLFFQKEVIAI